MNFIGNKNAISFLSESIKKGNVSHSYIFCGPENVGKFSLAKKIAEALIYSKEISLELDSLEKNIAMDMIELLPEIVEKKGIIKQKDIPIEKIREVQKKINLSPYFKKYKVLIINDAHRLTISSQNALLKTLEEPNQTSVIILVTSEVEKILPTIKSRCHIINFSLVSDEEISKNFDINPDICMGRSGIANKLINDIEKYNEYLETKEEIEKILNMSIGDKIKIAEKLSKNVTKIIEKMNIWIWMLRKKGRYDIIEKIEIALNLLKKTNANVKIILETLFLDI